MSLPRFPIFVFLCSLSGIAVSDPVYWQGIADEIAQHLSRAGSLYEVGRSKEAKQALTQAYFGVFEDRKMEAALRREIGAKATYQLEKRFGALRKAMGAGADPATVQDQAADLAEAVRREARGLDAAGVPPQVFAVEGEG